MGALVPPTCRLTQVAASVAILAALFASPACSLPTPVRPDAGPEGDASEVDGTPLDLAGGDDAAADGRPDPDVPGLDGTSGPDAAATGLLTLTREIDPRGGDVDLTAEGTIDWAHFGLAEPEDFNHRIGIEPQIGRARFIGDGSVGTLGDCCTDLFSWSDGTPRAMASQVRGGVLFDTGAASGTGMELEVMGGETPRLLRLYVGGYCTQVQLVAGLADDSAAPQTDSVTYDAAAPTPSLYSLRFRGAQAGVPLQIRLTISRNDCLTGDVGEIWLIAASLAESPSAP